jgi:hypothetical protein
MFAEIQNASLSECGRSLVEGTWTRHYRAVEACMIREQDTCNPAPPAACAALCFFTRSQCQARLDRASTICCSFRPVISYRCQFGRLVVRQIMRISPLPVPLQVHGRDASVTAIRIN